jgi:hypothetical protein
MVLPVGDNNHTLDVWMTNLFEEEPVTTGTAHGIHFRVVQMKYRAFLDTVSLKYSLS